MVIQPYNQHSRRLRKEDHEFEAILGTIMRNCLKQRKKKRKESHYFV
jgi:hypothetical protein